MKLFRKKFIIPFVLVIVVVLVVVFVVRGKAPVVDYSSIVVDQKDLIQSVSETGSVDANLSLTYGWETSGQVVDIAKHIGDTVVAGDVIALLDNTQQQARFREALSQLSSAQARLNVEFAGPSDEDKRKSQTAVDQTEAQLVQAKAELLKAQAQAQIQVVNAQKVVDDAENNLRLADGGDNSQIVTDAYEDLVNTLKSVLSRLTDGLTDADSILGVDNRFANDDFEKALGFRGREYIDTAERSYIVAKKSIAAVSSKILGLTSVSGHEEVDQTVVDAFGTLADMQQLLFDVQALLSVTDPVAGFTQTELNVLVSSIATSITNVNAISASLTNDRQAVVSARNSVVSYQIAYTNAVANYVSVKQQTSADIAIAEARVTLQEASLSQAQATYDVLVAPPRQVDIGSLRADVSRYQSNVVALQDTLDQTKLIALGAGVISSLSVEVGENVTANQDVLTINSPELSVEVDISESDIATVAVGDIVAITLDAFGDDVMFTGEVIQIEPAETEISGVVYYKTDIIFTEGELLHAVRPGMTANITVYTDKRANALVIPQRAILEDNGEKYVRVITNKKPFLYERRIVTTGLRGDDGGIEVLSGLSVGEEIITFLDGA